MATLKMQGQKFTIGATNAYKLSNASNEGENGGVIVHIVNDGTFVGTITVKAQANAIDQLNGTDSLLAIPYRSLNVNATAGTGAYVSTAITTTSLIFIPAGGLTPVLDVAWTSGTASVYVTPVLGSCAV